MSLTLHEVSVPVLTRGLTILSTLLEKAEAHASGSEEMLASYFEARLAPDMLTLAGQVQRASDTAKFAAARLTATEGPSFADEETTFGQLRERCAKTVAYLASVTPAAFEGATTRAITFGGGGYTASKAAVNAFTESLALELEPFGVRVRLVIPGRAPETAFGQNARARMTDGFPEPYASLVQEVFAAWQQQPPDEVTRSVDVAEAVWRAATDPACPMRLPAGADAVALAGQGA